MKYFNFVLPIFLKRFSVVRYVCCSVLIFILVLIIFESIGKTCFCKYGLGSNAHHTPQCSLLAWLLIFSNIPLLMVSKAALNIFNLSQLTKISEMVAFYDFIL